MAIAHFLIGTPASGKSTLAKEMTQHFSNCVLVSTDAIRQQIFSEPTLFGNWEAVSAEVLSQVQTAIAAGQTVIYDATNAKRAWRINILQQFKAIEPSIDWIGWHIQTPKELCQAWNSQREAKVPAQVIDNYYAYLDRFPPDTSEGLAIVKRIDPLANAKPSKETICVKDVNENWNWQGMEAVIKKLPRSVINRKTKERAIKTHRYSTILAFDRLMFILSLLLRYPELGCWHITQPQELRSLLGLKTDDHLVFANEAAEICAVLSREYDGIYADPQSVQEDLAFLQTSGLINSPYITTAIEIPPYIGDPASLLPHQYSDHETCCRVLTVFRFIAHHPFLKSGEETISKGVQQRLIANLKSQIFMTAESLRKDIEKLFKPYQLFPSMDLRKGYFVGTSIFQPNDLKAIFHIMQAQVKSLQDPIALAAYDNFCSRLQDAQIFDQPNFDSFYPVRAISRQSIVDIDSLKNRRDTIYEDDNLSYLETAIEKGELLELRRFSNSGRFLNDPIGKDPFLAYPVQIVFDKIAWYLGFEFQKNDVKGLFRYERLDRLAINHKTQHFRTPKEQRQALANLQKLTEASYSLFLGNSYLDQQQILKGDTSAEITVEFYCNDYLFAFLAEGSLRFPKGKMQMSPPIGGKQNHHSSQIYRLKPNNDPNYPHQFRVTLPKWVNDDVYLMRWLFSYGNNIRIVSPISIRNGIKKFAKEICELYESLGQ